MDYVLYTLEMYVCYIWYIYILSYIWLNKLQVTYFTWADLCSLQIMNVSFFGAHVMMRKRETFLNFSCRFKRSTIKENEPIHLTMLT
jgi:hypothetical protein